MASNMASNSVINFGATVATVNEQRSQQARNYDEVVSELRQSDKLVMKYLGMRQQLNSLVKNLDEHDDNVVNIVNGLQHLQTLHETFTTDIQVLQQVDDQNVQRVAAVFSDIQPDMQLLQTHITNLNETLTNLKRDHQNEMRKLSVNGLE